VPPKAADHVRNVALIGHRGSGKTSLHEAMLFEAGAVNRLGSVEDGSTISDHEPDERRREHSINACVSCFQYADREINLIDTPGDPSFVADVAAPLRVADSSVVVVNGVAGVEVQTERLWQRADAEGLARLVFVNMLDRERADFFLALDSLKAAFGPHVVATEIPIGSEHDMRGVVDLIDMKAFVYEGSGRAGAERTPIPDELRPRAEQYREKLMDEVAENSDALMERYLEGEEIDHAEIVAALKRGVTEGHSFRSPAGSRPGTWEPTGCSTRWSRIYPRRRCGARWRRSVATARRSRSCPTPTGRWSPMCSRRPPTPTPVASTSSASTAARCVPTRRRST
jgi:elongation factor G